MRFAPAPAAALVLALGAVLGGFAASSVAEVPAKSVQQSTAASAPETDTVGGTGDNNGNG